MSCLTICQAACGASGFAVPSTIIGNSDDTATMLLRLLNKSGKQRAKYEWQALQKEYTFSFVASQANYAFPSDLGFFVNETAWDRTQFWSLRGSLSAQEWQLYKSGLQSSTPRQRFRIKSGQIYIDPTPSSTDSCVIEYISSKWVTDGSSFFTAFSADGQTSLLDEDMLELDLTWRFLERKGLAYAEARDEADRFAEKLLGRDTPKDTINVAGAAYAVWPPLPTVPVTGYTG